MKSIKIIIEVLPGSDIPHIKEEIKKVVPKDKLIKIITEEPGDNF